MNFKNIKKFLKKNYKKIIVVCLILLLFSNKMYENFSTTDALNAVASTEIKVNNMATKVGADYTDFKSGIRLSKNWMSGATATNSEISNDTGSYKKLMIIGNKSSGTRKVGIWDHLDVHGNQDITGSLNVSGTATVNSLKVPVHHKWIDSPFKAHAGKLEYLDTQNIECPSGEYVSGIRWRNGANFGKGRSLSTSVKCTRFN
jgi:hypothetical protein